MRVSQQQLTAYSLPTQVTQLNLCILCPEQEVIRYSQKTQRSGQVGKPYKKQVVRNSWWSMLVGEAMSHIHVHCLMLSANIWYLCPHYSTSTYPYKEEFLPSVVHSASWSHGQSRHLPTCFWKWHAGLTELCPYETPVLWTPRSLSLLWTLLDTTCPKKQEVNRDHHPDAHGKWKTKHKSLTPHFLGKL